MATRAAFYVGDPTNGGRLLGCIAFDGYPDGDCRVLGDVVTEQGFEAAVAELASNRDDWTPAEDGFPFPWEDNVFITDWVYAFFNGQSHASCFGHGWHVLGEMSNDPDEQEGRETRPDLPPTPAGVPRCRPGKGKDSIILFTG